MDFIRDEDPNTLLVTAADSEADGIQVWQPTPFGPPLPDTIDSVAALPVNPTDIETAQNSVDGVEGRLIPLTTFAAQPSLDGDMGNFVTTWAGNPDFAGNVVAKAYGLNADLLSSTIDNTFIYEMDDALNGGSGSEAIAELIDLTGFDSDVSVSVSLTREAVFNNVLKFYEMDAEGRVDDLLPGDARYEEAVAENLLDAELVVGNGASTDATLVLAGGTYYAPALLIDGNFRNLATIDDAALGRSRIQRNGNVWGFEDLSDNDFNDDELRKIHFCSFSTKGYTPWGMT